MHSHSFSQVEASKQSGFFTPTNVLYSFIIIHLICWTAAPILLRANLPLDAIEGTIWGHQLEWGYDKNPFLNGWLTSIAMHLSWPSGWMIYFFSQLSVALAMFATYQLSKRILSPWHAVIAVLLLEALQYFNFHAIDFNDNTLELSLWSLTIYFFYRALQSPKNLSEYSNWLLTGFFAGFGMMAKYYTAALLAAMFIFLIMNKTARTAFLKPPIYFAIATLVAIMLPHVIWLFSHDFITVKYVFMRTESNAQFSNHFTSPLQFAFEQLQVFLPVFFFIAILLFGKQAFIKTRSNLKTFDRQFLFYVGLGPFLLTLLLALATGIKLRAGWGMPLLTLWTTMLIAIIQPSYDSKRLKRLIISIYIFMTLLLIGYGASLIYSKDESSANFPGRELAAVITERFQEMYHSELAYVGGSRWLSGNIEFYSPAHPSVYIDWNKRVSFWINDDDVRKKGAVYVWELNKTTELPDYIKALQPSKVETITLNWQRNQYHLAPIKIGVAYLAPT